MILCYSSGVGIGIVYTTCVVAVTVHLPQYRTIAVGASMSGMALGNFIYPYLANVLKDIYGWRGALIITSGLTLNVCVYAMLIGLEPRDAETRKKRGSHQQKSPDQQVVSIKPTSKCHSFVRLHYWLLHAHSCFMHFGLSIIRNPYRRLCWALWTQSHVCIFTALCSWYIRSSWPLSTWCYHPSPTCQCQNLPPGVLFHNSCAFLHDGFIHKCHMFRGFCYHSRVFFLCPRTSCLWSVDADMWTGWFLLWTRIPVPFGWSRLCPRRTMCRFVFMYT